MKQIVYVVNQYTVLKQMLVKKWIWVETNFDKSRFFLQIYGKCLRRMKHIYSVCLNVYFDFHNVVSHNVVSHNEFPSTMYLSMIKITFFVNYIRHAIQ